jgi:hypothetical protein
MQALAVFTVWRASVTDWRSTRDRFYFFPNTTWIGSIDHYWLGDALRRIDRSWLNDFLLGPGTVACFFVAFTLLYAVGGFLHQDTVSIFNSNRNASSPSAWADHKKLMKIILYALLVRALVEGWAEEVGILASPFVFDPWDLTVELGGIVFAAWLVYGLSYPLFSRVPHFPPGEFNIPLLGPLFAGMGIDALSVIATGFYVFIVNPFELEPLKLLERQSLALEVAVVFVTFRAALKRGMNLPADCVSIGLGYPSKRSRVPPPMTAE